jgi:hypothetical protein
VRVGCSYTRSVNEHLMEALLYAALFLLTAGREAQIGYRSSVATAVPVEPGPAHSVR